MRIAYIPRVVDIQRSITDVTHVVDVLFFSPLVFFFSKPFRLYLDGNEGEPAPLLFLFMSCMYVSVPRYEKKIWRHIDIDLMLNIPTLCYVLNYRFAPFSFHVVFLVSSFLPASVMIGVFYIVSSFSNNRYCIIVCY